MIQGFTMYQPHEVQIGAVYRMKIQGNLIPVAIVDLDEEGTGWYGRNTRTGEFFRIKDSGDLIIKMARPASYYFPEEYVDELPEPDANV